MTKTNYTVPATLASQVDELGVVKANIKDLQFREGLLKAAIEKNGQGSYFGTLFVATVSYGSQTRLDIAKMRASTDPAILVTWEKTVPTTSIAVQPRALPAQYAA